MMWLDAYERRCRLAPGLLALVPVAVTIVALGIRDAPVVSAAISILSLASGPVLIASIVRRKGLAAQEFLWTKWGGPPTTDLLRTRQGPSGVVQRDAWRQAVEIATKVPLLSPRAEKSNPDRADETIELAVAKLREATRTDSFPLIAAENRNYGFERNFYAIRATGRMIALICIVVIGAAIAVRLNGGRHPSAPNAYVLGVVINPLVLIGWFALPSEGRVRVTAEKYARQLLQGAVTLSEQLPVEKEDAPAAPAP